MRRSKKVKNLLAAMLIMVIVSCINTNLETKAQAASISHPMPINAVFPDGGLAKAVKTALKKKHVTDLVTQKELNEIGKYLYGNDLSIESLEGIQYLNCLEQLYLSRNQISDLSPLKDLKNLVILCLDENKLKNLEGISSTKLVRLLVDGNEITDVSPLAKLTQLEILSISKNKLSNIDPLAELTKLRVLDLESNKVSDLSAIGKLKKLNSLNAACQKCVNEPVAYKAKLAIPNIVKGPDNVLVLPTDISDNGEYTNISGKIKWKLSTYTKEVSYKYVRLVEIGEAEGQFDVTVVQPLHLKGLETCQGPYYNCLAK
ncbi:leucine-rich repeat domain-containing protein [Listeria ivanovii]|uniref:Leucine-rich repeat domain-containing protein n=2 Tax=Listeria ivanovii TaxID=1638 RepID=A0ABS1G5Q9_LISIV|nr:leucine-rich repeat domain-containing protein [Listeria ivanovii]AIS60784.1 internalin [Listeria ivanovii subsp. londoniensis]MBK1962217.1 leucine-rich repeat domain-containing protein [Listeria ivanovii subsp. londoniensis]MBK2002598.1 leucine-rich repeat domain-containing protein [Listeria ivanovii subsp. londoniensis]MBM5608705.1 internalin [Listeria ivanovii]MBM5636741.1 internalin [Listeria ivanovii]